MSTLNYVYFYTFKNINNLHLLYFFFFFMTYKTNIILMVFYQSFVNGYIKIFRCLFVFYKGKVSIGKGA